MPFSKAIEGVSVVRGRLPGASEEGRPSSSQNIWAREFSGKPSSGMTGEDCSQPPEGVAAIMLPHLSMTSIWTVSPLRPAATIEAMVGSPTLAPPWVGCAMAPSALIACATCAS